MVHSSLHEDEQDVKVGESGWLGNGELGVVPAARKKRQILDECPTGVSLRGGVRCNLDRPVEEEEEKVVW